MKQEEGHTPNLLVPKYADGTKFRCPKDCQLEDNDPVAKEFGEWLFSEQHRSCTIIAHNFCSYDGHFILKYLMDNQYRKYQGYQRETQLLDLQCEKAEINAGIH